MRMCFVILWAVVIVLPYLMENGWRFVPVTLVLLLAARRTWPGDWRDRLGLGGSALPWLAGAALFAILQPLSWTLVSTAAAAAGWRLDGAGAYAGQWLCPIFQTLNEEMLFRALLLTQLTRRGLSPLVASVGAAVAFVLAHVAFYPVAEGGPLTVGACATLLFLGIGANGLFLATGTIALPWAIHAAWNQSHFGWGAFVDGAGVRLTEAMSFNVLVGQPPVITGAAVLAVAGAWLAWGQRRRAPFSRMASSARAESSGARLTPRQAAVTTSTPKPS